jgi:hypothetical protein
MSKTESALRNYEYMWCGNTPSMSSREATGYRVPGPKAGQEIYMNNVGHPQRQDWEYLVYEHGSGLCCNRHFGSPEDALASAYEWLDLGKLKGLTLRSFVQGCGVLEWFTVDGLPSSIEVAIVEATPGNWRFQVLKNDTGWGQWNGPWLSLEEAFAAFQSSFLN